MTDEVAALVLRDNYLQGEALSVAEARGAGALDRQARLIRDLERAGRLDRALEFLPDDETLAARAAARRGLTRPELAVLLAYAKMSLDHELLALRPARCCRSWPTICATISRRRLRDRFAAQIAAHPLRARSSRPSSPTISSTAPASPSSTTCARAPAATAPDIARAYRIVREVFELPALWAEIEALDNQVAASVQTEMLLDIAGSDRACRGLAAARQPARSRRARSPASRRRSGASRRSSPELLPPSERALLDERAARFAEAGVPPPLAAPVAGVIFLTTAFEIGDLAERAAPAGRSRRARSSTGVGARFALDEMRAAAAPPAGRDAWQKTAVESADRRFLCAAGRSRRARAGRAPTARPTRSPPGPKATPPQLAPAEAIAAELRTAAAPDLAMLVVAGTQLRQALGTSASASQREESHEADTS